MLYSVTQVSLSLLVSASLLLSGAAPAQQPDPRIQVREGYRLTVAVTDIQKPRFMEIGPDGVLYVTSLKAGQVKACRDKNGDGLYETISNFYEGHSTTHALHWHDGWLWIAETDAVWRARDTDGDGVADEKTRVLGPDVLPGGGGHWWRSLLIHDDRLYTSIGDSGNITDQTATKRQKIWSYDLEGQDEKLFASGLRNTEKLVLRPGTTEIWGMDHGSDWFGGIIERPAPQHGQPITDLNPPEEMNRYVQDGFYGHPFVTGKRLPRYEFMDRPDIAELAAKTIPPEWSGGAHWAANAMEFYSGDHLPGAKGDAFVAYHGSWNSSTRVGYCVTRVLFDAGRPYGELVYVRFLTDDQQVLGRPVDAVMEKDGALLISEDHGDRIYRLRHAGD